MRSVGKDTPVAWNSTLSTSRGTPARIHEGITAGMHCRSSFPEGLESVTPDPSLLITAPRTYHGSDEGGVSEEVNLTLGRFKCGGRTKLLVGDLS